MTPRLLLHRLLRLLSRERVYKGTRGLGQRWERLAEDRLVAAGYRIRERNFRARAGEVDFIAEEKGVLCFVEVKGRSGTGFGLPAEAVTAEKQSRLIRAAQEYLWRRRLRDVPCRFDVVSVLETERGTQVTILRGAFERPAESDTRGI